MFVADVCAYHINGTLKEQISYARFILRWLFSNVNNSLILEGFSTPSGSPFFNNHTLVHTNAVGTVQSLSPSLVVIDSSSPCMRMDDNRFAGQQVMPRFAGEGVAFLS